MKRRLLVTLFLIGFLFLPSAMAVSNQGLSWGVTEGQSITFSVDADMEMSVMTFTVTSNESYNLVATVDSLPDIPEDIDSLAEIPVATLSFSFENGTDIGEGVIPPESGLGFIMPIGNWSLMTDLIDDLYGSLPASEFTWLTDATYWGYELTMSSPGMEMEVSFTMTKTDGVLYNLHMLVDLDVLGTTETTIQRLGGGIDTTMLLIIGGGAVALIVVIAVIMKMR